MPRPVAFDFNDPASGILGQFGTTLSWPSVKKLPSVAVCAAIF